jgi:hypothetical protein
MPDVAAAMLRVPSISLVSDRLQRSHNGRALFIGFRQFASPMDILANKACYSLERGMIDIEASERQVRNALGKLVMFTDSLQIHHALVTAHVERRMLIIA